jgi:hypothetical protein
VSVDISSDGQYIVAGSTYTQNMYFFNRTNSTPFNIYNTGSAVNSVSISSDGQCIAAAGSMVHYFRINVSVPQWSLSIGTVNSVSISSNAVYIAATTGNYVYLLMNDGSTIWNCNIGGSVGTALFSANGEYIVTKSGNYVHVFSKNMDGNPSTSTHEPVWSYDAKAVVNSVSISSDGRYTVAGSGTYVYTFDITSDPDLTPTYIQFSNNNPTDGDTITISARINNTDNLDSPSAFVKFYVGTILIGTKSTGSIPHGSSKTVSTSFTVSPSGGHIVKVIVDPENLIYESNENNNNLTKDITVNSFPFEGTGANPIVTDVTQTGTVNSLSISANAYYIVLGTSDSYAYLFFRNHTLPIWSYNAGSSINVVSVSGDGSYIAAASQNMLIVFSRTNNEPLWSFVNDPVYDWGGIHSLAFSSDGGLLVVGTWGYDDARTWVHLFNVTSGIKIWSYLVDQSNKGSQYDYVSVDISSDGQYIVAGSTYTQNVYFFNSRESTPVYSYDTGAAVSSVAMSLEGSKFVAGGNRVYYFSKDVIVPSWTHDIGESVTSLSISNDSTYIAVTSASYVRVMKNNKTQLFAYNLENVNRALISDDGSLVAASKGNYIYSFLKGNDEKFELILNYDAKDPISSFSLSSDGKYVVASSLGKILFFDTTRSITEVPTDPSGTILNLPAGAYGASQPYQTDSSKKLISALPQSITVQPGESVTLNCTFQIWSVTNPSEKEQLFLIQSWTTNWPPEDHTITLYNGVPGTYPGKTQAIESSFTAPNQDGTYYLWLCWDAQNSIDEAINRRTSSMSGLPAHIKLVVTTEAEAANDDEHENNEGGMVDADDDTVGVTPVVLHDPSNPTATSVHLTWTQENNVEFLKHDIFMSQSSGTLGSFVGNVTDQSITSYEVTGLTPSTTYYFTVRTVNIQGNYTDSNQVSITTLGSSITFDGYSLLVGGLILTVVIFIIAGVVYALKHPRKPKTSTKVYKP